MEGEQFVFPGMEIGFAEEFIPGEGTYEEDGKIFASVTGAVVVDPKERKISVSPKTSTIPILKNGDVVIGAIVDVKQQLAIVDVLKLKGNDRALPGSISGTIHISQVRDSYVADISREFRGGDIVEAVVVNADRMSIQLSTVGKDLGVLRAFCFSCNTPLRKHDTKLKCDYCGRVELRRLSPDYGRGTV